MTSYDINIIVYRYTYYSFIEHEFIAFELSSRILCEFSGNFGVGIVNASESLENIIRPVHNTN